MVTYFPSSLTDETKRRRWDDWSSSLIDDTAGRLQEIASPSTPEPDPSLDPFAAAPDPMAAPAPTEPDPLPTPAPTPAPAAPDLQITDEGSAALARAVAPDWDWSDTPDQEQASPSPLGSGDGLNITDEGSSALARAIAPEWDWGPDQPSGLSGVPQASDTPTRFPRGTSGSVAAPAQLDTSGPDAFLGTAYRSARAAAARHGLGDAAARVAAGIAANETGYGKAVVGNNYFGIKGSNPRTGANTGPVDTWEDYGRGRVDIKDTFRAYDDPAQSFDDFFTFLEDNPRYAGALQKADDPAAFARAIHAAGYATDPAWSDKIVSIAGRVPSQPSAVAAVSTGTGEGSQRLRGDALPDQAALDDPDKWALCGPVAATLAAQRFGPDWTVAQAKKIAAASDLWDAGNGMHGLQSEVTLLNKMGVSAASGAADPSRLAQDAAAGNTPIISTPKHYFVLQGYDPETGRFDTGTTGSVLRGGSRYLTLDQIASLGGGLDGAAYIDNPSSPTPSVVATKGDATMQGWGGLDATMGRGHDDLLGATGADAPEASGNYGAATSRFGGFTDDPSVVGQNTLGASPTVALNPRRLVSEAISDYADASGKNPLGDDALLEGARALIGVTGHEVAHNTYREHGPELDALQRQIVDERGQPSIARAYDTLRQMRDDGSLTNWLAASPPPAQQGWSRGQGDPGAMAWAPDEEAPSSPPVRDDYRTRPGEPPASPPAPAVSPSPSQDEHPIVAGLRQAGQSIADAFGKLGEALTGGSAQQPTVMGSEEMLARPALTEPTVPESLTPQARASDAPGVQPVGPAVLGDVYHEATEGIGAGPLRGLGRERMGVEQLIREDPTLGPEWEQLRTAQQAPWFRADPNSAAARAVVDRKEAIEREVIERTGFGERQTAAPRHPEYEPTDQALGLAQAAAATALAPNITGLMGPRASAGELAGSFAIDPGGQATGAVFEGGLRGLGAGARAARGLAGDARGVLGEAADRAGTFGRDVLAGANVADAPPAGNVARASVRTAEEALNVPPPPPGHDRFYHGTGSEFTSPEGARFDQADSHGPAYYLTTSPDKAGTYSEMRAGERGGTPNIRAVDVPSDLRLLDDRAPVPDDVLAAVERAFGPDAADRVAMSRTMERAYDILRGIAGGGESLDAKYGGDAAKRVNDLLASIGYDGFRYGLRSDLREQPIRAIAIFPESLPKLRNAVSGLMGGMNAAPEMAQGVGGTLGRAGAGFAAGASSTYADPTQYDEQGNYVGTLGEQIKRGAAGAVLAVAGPRLGRAARDVAPGLMAQAERNPLARQERAAELSRPITLTDEEQIKRIALDKFPQEMRDDLLNAARGRGFGERLRRGVLSDKAVQTLAEEYAPSIESAIASSRRGRAYSAEEIVGLRNLMVGQSERVRTLADEIASSKAGGSLDIAAMAQLAGEQKKLALLGDIVFGGAPAEAGRALRQFRQEAQSLEVDPAGAGLRYLKQQFGSLEKAEETTAQYLSMVQTGAGPLELTKFLQGAHGSWLNRLAIVRYASMLSSTTTHALNSTSNALVQGARTLVATPFAAGIDVARVSGARALGMDAERQVFFTEVPVRLHGMLGGAVTGLGDAAFIMRHGIRPDEITKLDSLREGFGTNIPKLAPRGSVAAEATDLLMEGPLRALSAADAFFRHMSEGGHLAGEAYAAAAREAKGRPTVEAIAEKTRDLVLMERAADLARRDVLQEDNFGRVLARFQRGIQNPVARAGAEAAMPFIGTPYSVMAQGIGMTPAGVVRAIQQAKAGDVRAAEQSLGEVAMGTAMMAGAAQMYGHGMLTGAYPEEQSERSTLPPGWQPWSFKTSLPNGQTRYFSMAPLGPLAVPFVAMILNGEIQKRNPQANLLERSGQIALGMGKYAVDQTFFRGISDIAKAMSDGGSRIENLTESLASQYSPHVIGGGALGRQIQQIMGQPQRDPQGALEALLATHPLTADRVPPRRDVLGRPVRNAPGGVESALSPIRGTVEHDAPVLKAFRAAGEGLPMKAPSKVPDPRNPKEDVPLNRAQQALWRIAFGGNLQELWDAAGGPSDADSLQKIEMQARKRAAAEVLE